MDKTAVKEMGKHISFPLPGGKSRIAIQYSQPDKHEDRYEIFVDGWLTSPDKVDEKGNKIPAKFKGFLIKSFGQPFKDVAKDLTDSLERANEQVGGPIEDVHSFVGDRIVESIPYKAMDVFFKKIKEKGDKKPKKKQPKGEQPKKKHFKGPPPLLQKLEKGTNVKVDIDKIYKEDGELFSKINSKYDDIYNFPYANVYESSYDGVVVIFKNQSYETIPRKYLKPYQKDDKFDMEKMFSNAYKFYLENRIKKPELIDLSLIESMVSYKEAQGIPLDEVDKTILEARREEKRAKEAKKGQQESGWIKKLFNK